MKSVFVINDNTVEARHVAESALMMAKTINAKLIIGNRLIKSTKSALSYAFHQSEAFEEDTYGDETLLRRLNLLNTTIKGELTDIEEVDISSMDSHKLSAFINAHNVTLLMISTETVKAISGRKLIDYQTILNKISAPIFLIPASWSFKKFRSITYITDLRYCRTDVLSYLTKVTLPFNTNIYVGHMAASGLPDLSPDFAKQVFYEAARRCTHWEHLNFHHIHSKDISTVADVLIHGMSNDALVLINHSQHYHYFIGKQLMLNQPELINVPLLLYPH
ncbi:hypothetical protein [Mucilaginibacter sp.]|uniref:hypothetical protein n=1 Tax=Mucilaginibacter sp. TaxID=1882438 RepID=UPI000CAD8CF7|nr:hypothetical protein [Mucilaginibacter sp.]PLW88309.1 MAG: hypothetical protein C0154_17255 [Mucilaginibacter sp.]PMP65213.1 MAG: hypothetical protein C0191_04155 [Mucilaginibacter sp.]HEK19216.1 hypothetical protein [Bacteroidota bacterium]